MDRFNKFLINRIYLQRLLKIIEEERVKFNAIRVFNPRQIFELDLNDYCYIHIVCKKSKSKIKLLYVDLNKYRNEVEFSIAHELGHYRLWKERSLEDNRKIDCAYNKFEDGFFNNEEKELVIREEEDAWKYGREILEKIEFEDFSGFDEYKTFCLKEYRGI